MRSRFAARTSPQTQRPPSVLPVCDMVEMHVFWPRERVTEPSMKEFVCFQGINPAHFARQPPPLPPLQRGLHSWQFADNNTVISNWMLGGTAVP